PRIARAGMAALPTTKSVDSRTPLPEICSAGQRQFRSVLAFLNAFRRWCRPGRRAGRKIAVVLDGSGSHTGVRVRWPTPLQRLRLPSLSPELNPAERWFEELRAVLANRVFDTLADLEAALAQALRPYWEKPQRLVRLLAYPWWREAVRNITTL
ncbi:MAG: transposase, partial [Trebonia sp.]